MPDLDIDDEVLLLDAKQETEDNLRRFAEPWKDSEPGRNGRFFAPHAARKDRDGFAFCTDPSPGPKGGPASEDIEWARVQRRRRAAEYRGR